MSLHIFGIRHHGPGSARSLKKALETLQPDILLIEGPPEADGLLELANHPDMKPPVALLLYNEAEPARAVYYPFAEFSPEWQAILYGRSKNIPIRFMDLPQSHQLMAEPVSTEAPIHANLESPDSPPGLDPAQLDPLGVLAEAAGYSDGERWWEHMVESRREGEDLFGGVLEAMTALREDLPPPEGREALREAHMRQTIRAAQAEGFQKIAVVCGAWHGPALLNPNQDAVGTSGGSSFPQNLPKAKVKATWVPWTHGRLAYASGYGAGIESPGWYYHLWHHPKQVTIRWMSRVAQTLRKEDLEAPTASVIEAVRLAESLAALRDHPLPGLPELGEAAEAIFGHGSTTALRFIEEKLILNERLGQVPAETPSVPLQANLEREQKRLRLKVSADWHDLELDLRKEIDLARSQLFHRLKLLGVEWGKEIGTSGKGTFKEAWRLQWQPEFAVSLIEASAWGQTLEAASNRRVHDLANAATSLPPLTELLEQTLLARLGDATAHLMGCIEAQAAQSSDIAHLMGALPPLAKVMRYGNVRQTDTRTVGHVVAGLLVRVCVGLPNACAALSDEAAAEMYGHLLEVNTAVTLLQNPEQLSLWQETLERLSGQQNLHGLIAGRICRILLEASVFSQTDIANRMSLALGLANDPTQVAGWLEGFLKGSGLVLLHDEVLWGVLEGWLMAISEDQFVQVLPLLRRTFGTFPAPERRAMGEQAKRGPAKVEVGMASSEIDLERAEAVIPLLKQLLGVRE